MTESIILSLDTASMGGSVWLGKGITELATVVGDPTVSQSASLLNDINRSLERAGLKLDEVELFACASGPGSFTGLRIGIATLKALAASLERPCFGISTLHAVARAAGPSSATVALLPAGRGEVFAQRFSVSDDLPVTALDAPGHLTPQKLIERYAAFPKLKWAGRGAEAQREIIQNQAQLAGSSWSFAQPEANLARHIAGLALELFESGEIQSPHSLRAIYVRPSDAELNQKCL
jgi:tRNA threonylcarbamoyladenosine biosynthesis protein TsaB